MYSIDDFDFVLPDSSIAQEPVTPRSSSRLLVFDSKSGKIFHHIFRDLPDYLDAGDTLVVNNSKVSPARINFKIKDSSKEIFILKSVGKNIFEVLLKPAKSFKIGVIYNISDNISFEVLKILEDGLRLVKFHALQDIEIESELERLGKIPLPPYIKDSISLYDRYQTVYAKSGRSVAAPTAGLHFDEDLIGILKSRGVNFDEVTLDVGLGTFRPVSEEKIANHIMHTEDYSISEEVAEKLNKVRSGGHRVIAVGTTAARVLESSATKDGYNSVQGSTNIFIYPGSHAWNGVDALITNFHLPKSTLLMLVSSFLEHKGIKNGPTRLLEIYSEAINLGYRFYSFGDAMIIL